MPDQDTENESRWPDEALTGFTEKPSRWGASDDVTLYGPNSAINDLREDNLHLLARVHELTEVRERLHGRIEVLEGEIKGYLHGLEQVDERYLHYKGETERLSVAEVELRRTISELETARDLHVMNLEEHLDVHGEQMMALNLHNRQLNDRIQELETERAALVERVSEPEPPDGLMERIAELARSLEFHKGELASAVTVSSDRFRRIKQLEGERAQLVERVSEMEQAFKNQTACTIAKHERVVELEGDLVEAKRNHEHACGTIAELFHAGTGTPWSDGPRVGVVEDVANERRTARDAITDRDDRIQELEMTVAGLLERAKELAHANWKAQECLRMAFG